MTTTGQTVFLRSVAEMGTTLIAANALALNVEAFSYMPAYGFGIAAATLVGTSLGAGNVAGALRGAGDTKTLMMIAIVCKGIIRILLTLLFIHLFHLGIRGAWLAMVIDQGFHGLLMFRRFRSGKWLVAGLA